MPFRLEVTTLNKRARAAVAVILTFVLIGVMPTVAFASPKSEKQAQAVTVKAQVDALDTKVEIASEDYNQADSTYQGLTKKVKAAEARLKVLTANQSKLQDTLGIRVRSMYRSGRLGPLEMLLGASTWDEFTTTWDVLHDMNELDAEAVAALKKTQADLKATKTSLVKNQADAKKQLDVMSARKVSIEKELASRKKMLAGLESEVAALQAAQDKSDAAAAARARSAAASVSSGGSSSGSDYGSPGNSAHSGVVAIAESKLGSPYRWAAAGPSTFDCSGFTMWVYAQVGISLPHSSRAQINCGQRVSRANLQPGDLVFFGTSVIHHVGIYVGGGSYIHAPHTGDVVKISTLDRSDYAGACRP